MFRTVYRAAKSRSAGCGSAGAWVGKAVGLLLVLAALLCAGQPAWPQFIQQRPKLPGEGTAVSLSGDGNTAIVGGVGNGAAVFIRSNGMWTQQGPNLLGSGAVGNAEQGASVAVSGDGNTAIMGGYNDNGQVGAAWIFIRSNGVWTQQGPKLVGTGYAGAPSQGLSVALSADGNTAIVGGPYDGPCDCDFGCSFTGAAWVFIRSNGVWSQQGPKLVGADYIGQSLQGNSVALSCRKLMSCPG